MKRLPPSHETAKILNRTLANGTQQGIKTILNSELRNDSILEYLLFYSKGIKEGEKLIHTGTE